MTKETSINCLMLFLFYIEGELICIEYEICEKSDETLHVSIKI